MRYNQKRPIIILFIFLLSCKEIKKEGIVNEEDNKASYFNLHKYKASISIDTINSFCSDFRFRTFRDSLIDEPAFITKYGNIIIKTKKYKNLYCCNLPNIINDYINDSILISGIVLNCYGNEVISGEPTILKEIKVENLVKIRHN